MSSVPVISAPPALAEGLMQVLSALPGLADLVGEVGELTTIRACFVINVCSEAEVDGAAASMGVAPERPRPGQYRAVAVIGAVTVTVAFCGRAAGEVHAVSA
jgi:hypothetical protein